MAVNHQVHTTPVLAMKALYRLLGIALVFFLIGGTIFLFTWDIPPPSAPIEKVIPNERFPN
ncbi:MAG: hypothetical protein CMM34_04785 [Rhodospirillaceae bacterium]|nr:hypothetical protein [Rhodospirillaceae bacterium]